MKKKSNKFWLAGFSMAGLCVFGFVLLGAFLVFSRSDSPNPVANSSLAVGSLAPDFELVALSGETMRLSQFRGQPVILSIGASWCPDCRKEAPLLEEVHQTYPELVILLVDTKESREAVQAFADEFNLTHPILLDSDGKVRELYQVMAIPTELFIDADGIIQAKIIEKVTPKLLAKYLPMIGVEQ